MKILRHKFVDVIPEDIEEGVVYISIEYATVIHNCCCGCGNEVVTPLSPAQWSLIFDGDTISLEPSIGNWNYECKSHYIIKKNKVIWLSLYTPDEISLAKQKDELDNINYFRSKIRKTH